MKNWREEILKYFQEPVPELTLAADPDGLFCDMSLQQVLGEKGIKVVQYIDPIVFRYEYESHYRDAPDRASLHLVVTLEEPTIKSVPFDIISRSTQIDVSFSSLFPKFASSVLNGLSATQIDAVLQDYDKYTGSPNDFDTMAFVIKTLFKIDVHKIDSINDVLEMLFIIYNSKYQVTENIAIYLTDKFSGISKLSKEIWGSEDNFLKFIQAEWNSFIAALQNKPIHAQETADAVNIIEEQYPIANKRIRVFLDDLFAGGKLKPVLVKNKEFLPGWTVFGVEYKAEEVMRNRLVEQIFRMSETLHEGMTYKEWMQAAALFGDIKEKALIINEGKDIEINRNFKQLQEQVDRLFPKWLLSSYNNLCNLPYLPQPVMVHHIPHFLASKKQPGEKIALIVLDGMSFVQWRQIRDMLNSTFNFDEAAVYAWIPTITSVSRQAIFCGERPACYADSIQTTAKEERHWQNFWEKQGTLSNYVEYVRIAKYPSSYEPYSIIKPNNKVKAIVVDLIDQLVHAALQGNRGLYEEVKLWLETGFLQDMLMGLLKEKFEVYITSDHGNRECIGTGKVTEGVLAHTRGERVRVYDSKLLRDKAAANYQGIPWDSPSLPVNMHTLLSPVHGAFIAKDEKIISHGSIALEEVIVPFIKVNYKERHGYHIHE